MHESFCDTLEPISKMKQDGITFECFETAKGLSFSDAQQQHGDPFPSA